jgi:hypothetical protein
MIMYSNIQKSEKYQQQKQINGLVELAEILPQRKGRQLVAGTCQLYYLLQMVVDWDDSLLSDFELIGFESDCHDLPVFDDFRQRCSPEYLAGQEKAIEAMGERAKTIVEDKCSQILSRFQSKDLQILECEIADELHFGP